MQGTSEIELHSVSANFQMNTKHYNSLSLAIYKAFINTSHMNQSWRATLFFICVSSNCVTLISVFECSVLSTHKISTRRFVFHLVWLAGTTKMSKKVTKKTIWISSVITDKISYTVMKQGTAAKKTSQKCHWWNISCWWTRYSGHIDHYDSDWCVYKCTWLYMLHIKIVHNNHAQYWWPEHMLLVPFNSTVARCILTSSRWCFKSNWYNLMFLISLF